MPLDVFLLDDVHRAEREARRPSEFWPVREAAGGRGAIYRQAEQFRRRVDRLDRGTVRQVLAEWRGIRVTLDREIRRLTDLIVDAEDVEGMRRALDRLRQSRDRVEATVARYAASVGEVVAARQTEAAGLAQSSNSALLGAQLPAAVAVRPLDAGQVEQLLGQLRSGPFQRVLDGLPGDYVSRLQQELVDGIGLGRSPRDVARRVGSASQAPRWRTLNIARTETLRAYREVKRTQWLANQDVVAGWTWLSAGDERTCPMCWAMHGRQFLVSETFGSHPSCRCDAVPRTRSWAELGFDGIDEPAALQIDDGPSLFARQPAHLQRQVLGPAKFQAYQDGQLSLQDLVGERRTADWGLTRHERSLKDVFGG